MNCSRFVRILADYQEGKLSPGERTAANAHLETCSACRRLLEIARGDIDISPGDVREALTRSILDRTSGAVCPRVESFLNDYVRFELGEEDSQLVAVHLDHCDGCRSVAENLAMLQEVLPTMAELDPGESFTREVVDVTSRSKQHQSGMQIRFLVWWKQLVRRPRFSFEAAYLGTLVLVFVLSGFVMMFRDVSNGKNSTAAIRPPSGYLLSVWAETKTPVSNQMNAIASATAAKGQAVSDSVIKLVKSCKDVSATILNNRIQGIRVWRQKTEEVLLASWNRLFHENPESDQ